ncbi:MAG: hypothetical protein IPK82_12360 [Polyangiaceae bacterium]|nr:hypothetical protein [Polyangiaceae bacterium]
MNRRLSLAFLALGISSLVLGALAVASTSWQAAWLGWPALSFTSLGVAYLGYPSFGPSKNVTTGKVTFRSKIFFAPYLLLTVFLWHVLRSISRQTPYVELIPGLWIGRRLLKKEYPQGLKSIADLTVEWDEQRPDGDVVYTNAPLLDGATLPSAELLALGSTIAQLPRPTYLHCAQGHGRTAMVAAAVLVATKHCASPQKALELIEESRPGARPSRIQRAAVLGMRVS